MRTLRAGWLLLALAAQAATAATLWVAPEGADNGPGTEAQPFATLTPALRAARAGDTILVKPGTYPGNLSWAAPGTAAQPVTLRAAGPGPAVIAGRVDLKMGWETSSRTPGLYAVAETGAVTGMAVDLEDSPLAVDDLPALPDLTALRGAYQGFCHDRAAGRLYVKYQGGASIAGHSLHVLRDGHGLAVTGSHAVLAGLTFRDFTGQGLQISSASQVTVRGCRISRCGYAWAAGIQVHQAADVTIEDCVLYRLRNGLIAQEATRLQLRHNTVYHTRAHGVYLIAGEGAVLRDNILYAGGGSGSALYVDPRAAAGLQADYNCYLDTGSRLLVSWMPLGLTCPTFAAYRAAVPGQDQHSLSADPLFVSTRPDQEDWRLQPTSPCRGRASDGGDLGARLAN